MSLYGILSSIVNTEFLLLFQEEYVYIYIQSDVEYFLMVIKSRNRREIYTFFKLMGKFGL